MVTQDTVNFWAHVMQIKINHETSNCTHLKNWSHWKLTGGGDQSVIVFILVCCCELSVVIATTMIDLPLVSGPVNSQIATKDFSIIYINDYTDGYVNGVRIITFHIFPYCSHVRKFSIPIPTP
jgi:hypothetical protein